MRRVSARFSAALLTVGLVACGPLPTASAQATGGQAAMSSQPAVAAEAAVPLAIAPSAPRSSAASVASASSLSGTSADAPAAAPPTTSDAQQLATAPDTTQAAVAPAAVAPATAPAPAVADALAVPVAPTGERASLGPLYHITQTFNNCGPASVAEVLRYWGVVRTQGQVQAVLRADGNPRGMVPYDVPAYARSLGLDALMGTRGDDGLVKALVANGFPVIVSQWVSTADHVGHYRPIEGFDDARGVFISADPYLGPNHQIGYEEFDQIWATNNGRFMVLYPPSKAPLLRSVLASAGWDRAAAYQADLAKLQRRLAQHQQPSDTYNRYWKGYSSLALAWDELQLAQFDSARASLNDAATQHANPVVVGWIAAEIAGGA